VATSTSAKLSFAPTGIVHSQARRDILGKKPYHHKGLRIPVRRKYEQVYVPKKLQKTLRSDERYPANKDSLNNCANIVQVHVQGELHKT
jgi:hypothetical protein